MAKNAGFVPGDLDLWPWPSNSSERGTKHVFCVNLTQIRSAVSEIFIHKKSQTAPKTEPCAVHYMRQNTYLPTPYEFRREMHLIHLLACLLGFPLLFFLYSFSLLVYFLTFSFENRPRFASRPEVVGGDQTWAFKLFQFILSCSILCSWCMVILRCSKFSYSRWPRFIVYFCGCFSWLVLISFSQYWSRNWLGRASPKWPILCRVGCKTVTQSVSQPTYLTV